MRAKNKTGGRLAAIALLTLVAALSHEAEAYSNNPAGIAGRTSKNGTTGTGCADCHTGTNDASVVISGPSTLNAGQAGMYTVTATKASLGAGVKMGMVVAASDSPTPLSASAANLVLYAATGEVIHASAGGALNTTNAGGSASYQFTYTMPSGATSGSSHTLYAVARLGSTGAWNYAPNLTVTTAGQTGPNPFTFTNQTSVALSTTITSAAVTITGSGGPWPISVSGATSSQYSIGCTATYTSAAGTIGNGSQVCVRHTSAATPLTSVSTTLNVGGVTGSFTSTTGGLFAITSPAPPNGSVGVAYSHTFVAAGATTFAVSSGMLPVGISLNPTSGVVSGTPATAGSYTATVTATNTSAGVATQTFNIEVPPVVIVYSRRLNPATSPAAVVTSLPLSSIDNCIVSEGCYGQVYSGQPNTVEMPDLFTFPFFFTPPERASINTTPGTAFITVVASRDIGHKVGAAAPPALGGDWLVTSVDTYLAGNLFQNTIDTCPAGERGTAYDVNLVCGPNYHTDVQATDSLPIPKAVFQAAAGDGAITVTLDPTPPTPNVTNSGVGRLKIFDVKLEFASQIPIAQPYAYQSQFGTSGLPNAVAVDFVTSNIVALDITANRVQIFNSAGILIKTFGTTGTGNGQFSGPQGVAIDQTTGNIFVTDNPGTQGRVQVFDSQGNYLRRFGSELSEADELAIDPVTRDIAVIDRSSGSIKIFSTGGLYLFAFGAQHGSGPGQFIYAQGIAIDPVTRNIIVGDHGSNRVQVFNSSGVFLSQLTGFSGPSGITVDPVSRNVIVTDSNNSNIAHVELFSATGSYLGQFGTPGTGNGQLVLPQGVATDAAGTKIIVADRANSRIQTFAVTTDSNVALASAGAVATASSINGADFPISAVNDGLRAGAFWVDGTYGAFPDWVQIAFNGTKTINRVVVSTLQDNFQTAGDPTDATTFSLYGITDFTVEGWNGSTWVTLGTVSGNNLAKRTVSFSAFTTDRIRINVTNARTPYSYVTEVEAWGTNAATPVPVSSNVALAAAGGVATASSSYGAAYPVTNVNDGVRAGNFWVDGTYGVFPDWVQVAFNGTKTIDHVVVTTLQDNFRSTVDPTDITTFSLYGITDYTVEGWDGASWVTLGTVSANSLVKRTLNFRSFATDRIRVNVSNARTPYSYITEIEAWGTTPQSISTNVARAGAGAVATASSSYGAAYPVTNVNDGVRAGGFWVDGTYGMFPDWVQIAFNGSKTIDRVIVTTLQDNFTSTVEPTDTTTFSLYGITDFTVQGWTGSSWLTLGSVANNNLAKRTVLFSPFTTDRVRVNVNGALTPYSYLAEVEAWGLDATSAPATSSNVALASAGAVATASSSYNSAAFPVTTVNDGLHAANYWVDGSYGSFPDWVQVNFSGTKTIDRVVVYTLQDNLTNPVEPSDTLTFSRYGITDFAIQGWNGSSWTTLGTVSGNNLVKRTVSFAPFATDRIRVEITNALTPYSYVNEIEAWGN